MTSFSVSRHRGFLIYWLVKLKIRTDSAADCKLILKFLFAAKNTF